MYPIHSSRYRVAPNDHTHPYLGLRYHNSITGGVRVSYSDRTLHSIKIQHPMSVDIAYKFTSAHLNQFIPKFYNNAAHHLFLTLFRREVDYSTLRQLTSCFRRFWQFWPNAIKQTRGRWTFSVCNADGWKNLL